MGESTFGRPGLPPNWSSASKQGVGTALNDSSRVWFTIAEGVVTEVFYPTVDNANIKDLQFLVTDGETFFDEERKDTVTKVEKLDPFAPAYRITNTARSGKYRIVKRMRSKEILRVVTFEPSVLHWSSDNWSTFHDDELKPSGLGLYFHDFPSGSFGRGETLVFTIFYTGTGRWEGRDYSILVV